MTVTTGTLALPLLADIDDKTGPEVDNGEPFVYVAGLGATSAVVLGLGSAVAQLVVGRVALLVHVAAESTPVEAAVVTVPVGETVNAGSADATVFVEIVCAAPLVVVSEVIIPLIVVIVSVKVVRVIFVIVVVCWSICL